MSTANSDSFNFFPYLDSLYTFFSSLIAIPRISKTMLNKKNGESEHRCLSSDLRNNAFTFSLLSMMLAVGLSYMVFIKLRYGSSVPTFWRDFFSLNIINGCWILSKDITASVEMIIWILIFSLLICCITLICRCWKVNASLGWIPLDHGVWSFKCIVGYGLLVFCWGFFHLFSSVIFTYNFLFFCGIFIWVWYQSGGGPITWVGTFSVLYSVFVCFSRIGVNCFLTIW